MSAIIVVGAEGMVCAEALMAFVDGDEDAEHSALDIDGTLALRCTC